MGQPDDSEWLTVQAVACRFGVSYWTALKWVHADLFDEVLHTRGIIRISRVSVERFAEKQQVTIDPASRSPALTRSRL